MPTFDDIRGLRFGPIGPNAVHIVVDVQRLFADATDWHTPGLYNIAPAIARIAAAKPERSLFSRFITPEHAKDGKGHWRHYYRRWDSVTSARLGPGMLDLVPVLAKLAKPGATFDKRGFSCFESPAFETALAERNADTLIVTGAETDVCVLATVLPAIDRGLRVIVVEDAVTSSSEAAHRAVMDVILPRYDQQTEVLTSADLLVNWTE